MNRPATGSLAGVRAVVLASGLALAGCAVGPDYHRPATVLPAGYAAPMTADEATIAADWWTVYNDPILNDLVRAALANNPNVRLALSRVEEARGALRETNAQFFPALSYSGVGDRFRSGVDGTPTSGASASSAASGSTTGTSMSTTTAAAGRATYGKLFNLDAGLSYELDLWGRLRRLSESSRAELLSTTYARDVATLSLAATTTQSYFALRSLDAQIDATKSTLDAVGKSLDIAQKRLSAGYSSGLDYAQADTLRAQTQVALRELRRQRAVQEHQLGNLTSNLALRIEPGNLAGLPVPAGLPPGLPSTLLERRPDVQRDEQLMVAANAQIGAAKAQLFPTFGLTGSYGGQSLALVDLLKAPFRFWTLGLGVSGPIFEGGKYLARLDEARSRGDEQIAVYQATVETAFQEVANSLTNVAESDAAEPEVMTQVEAARRTLRLSTLRYQSGYAGYLDVLDATRTANQAEITLVQNRAARLNYSVDLVKALGGGWTSDVASSAPLGPTAAAAAQTGATTAH